jgi:excisionase family DNA binding protein
MAHCSYLLTISDNHSILYLMGNVNGEHVIIITSVSQKGRAMLTQEQTEYLTADEAAVRTHVSSVTVRRAIHNGVLRYRAQRGRTKLLTAADVDAWARARTELRQLDDEEE